MELPAFIITEVSQHLKIIFRLIGQSLSGAASWYGGLHDKESIQPRAWVWSLREEPHTAELEVLDRIL